MTLEGTVKNRHEKRMAEEALEDLSGVRDVHNRLRVEGGFLSSLFGGGSDSGSQNTQSSMRSGSESSTLTSATQGSQSAGGTGTSGLGATGTTAGASSSAGPDEDVVMPRCCRRRAARAIRIPPNRASG